MRLEGLRHLGSLFQETLDDAGTHDTRPAHHERSLAFRGDNAWISAGTVNTGLPFLLYLNFVTKLSILHLEHWMYKCKMYVFIYIFIDFVRYFV